MERLLAIKSQGIRIEAKESVMEMEEMLVFHLKVDKI